MSTSQVDVVEKLVSQGLATEEYLFHYVGCEDCSYSFSIRDFIQCKTWRYRDPKKDTK